ncbi:hypothetical protein C8Q79DRAFT_981220 [Trametes meyenii]|nr:hypothetical protein C8Q79DRAFT_981220 [Trametes meyenii]
MLGAGFHGLWDAVASTHHSSQSADGSRSPSHSRGSTHALTETSSAEDDCEGDGVSQSSSSNESKKKTKIVLDPAQPPTVEGNPRARVFVACHDCRSRKIRCDGARPVCFNCRRRAPDTEVCDYDSAPKRRGQDRVPGMRTRSAVGTRQPRRLLQRHIGAPQESTTDSGGVTQLQWRYENMPDFHPQDAIDNFDPSSFNISDVESYQIFTPLVNEPEEVNEDEDAEPLTSAPSLQFTRETWWDSLLMLYASEDAGHALRPIPLTAEQRTSLTQRVFVDIRSLFRTSIYWGSFLHLPRFFETLLDPIRRMTLQPSLIMSMLAVGTFVQSSELRLGVRGRKRALRLVDQAHSALQASLSSNWVDVGLIQAAWLLTFFEMQAHPDQSTIRSRSAFLLLDSLIRLFSLTTLDLDVPNSRFSLFAVQSSAQQAPTTLDPAFAQYDCANNFFALIPPLEAVPSHHDLPQVPAAAGCNCEQYTLKQQWPAVLEVAPLWQATAMWPTASTEAEIRKEECRRLVWSSVTLAVGHNSYTSAGSTGVERTDLFIKHYDNYALLLPGEALAQAGTPVGHNNVWALFVRAMLLWHTGIRIRSDRFIQDFQRAQFAIDAWLEAEAIEDALNQHTCGLEQRLAYQAREFLFNARMSVSLDFQRFLPHIPANGSSPLYREMIETFLRRQMSVVQSLWDCMHTNPANELGTRSFLVYWFMGHVSRALVLWENDPTLILALDAAKLFVQPLEYLMQLWPCPGQREEWQTMRYKLVESCLKAGIPSPCRSLPPPPPRTGLCAPLVPLESLQLPPL